MIAIRNGIIPMTATVTSSSVYRFMLYYITYISNLYAANDILQPISLVFAKLLDVSVWHSVTFQQHDKQLLAPRYFQSDKSPIDCADVSDMSILFTGWFEDVSKVLEHVQLLFIHLKHELWSFWLKNGEILSDIPWHQKSGDCLIVDGHWKQHFYNDDNWCWINHFGFMILQYFKSSWIQRKRQELKNL